MGVPNGPAGIPPAAINPTGNGGTFSGPGPAPNEQLPATARAAINWVHNPGPGSPGVATAPTVTAHASILQSDGTPAPGSSPPYVVGDVHVSDDPAVLEAGTSIILTPPV